LRYLQKYGENHLAALHGHSHHPAEIEDPQLAAGNARRGLILFALYLAFYGTFVLLSAFGRSFMEQIILGVNVAVWYGFGLIVGALLLAILYSWLCRLAANRRERT
jgi:uncharacterized membrane protein (DUF485 family)